MGDRYYISIVCPVCYFKDTAYYAPTCGFIKWECINCNHIIDLEKLTGISYDEASNADLIERMINDIIN